MSDFLHEGKALAVSSETSKDWIVQASEWMNRTTVLEQDAELMGARGQVAAALVTRGSSEETLLSMEHVQQLAHYLDAAATAPATVLFGSGAMDHSKPAFDGLKATLSALCPGGAPYKIINPWMPLLVDKASWSPAPLLEHLSDCCYEQMDYAKSKGHRDYHVEGLLAKALFPMFTQTSWRPEPHMGYRCLSSFIDTLEGLAQAGIVWSERSQLQASVYRSEPADLVYALKSMKQRLVSVEFGELNAYFPLPLDACSDEQVPEAMDCLVKFLSTEERYRTKAPDPFSGAPSEESDEALEGAALMRLHHPQLMAIVDLHTSLIGGYGGCAPCLVEPFRSIRGAALPEGVVAEHKEVQGIQQTPGLFETC